MPADLIRIDLDPLYPEFMDALLELLARCRARGSDYFLTGGFRTPEEQLELWKRGRNKAGAVVKPSEVVTRVKFSAHCVGIAADLTKDAKPMTKGLQPTWNRADYEVLAEEAEKLNLEAGHRWRNFPDSPHVQLPYEKKNLTLSMMRGLYDKGGIPAVWGLLDREGPWR